MVHRHRDRGRKVVDEQLRAGERVDRPLLGELVLQAEMREMRVRQARPARERALRVRAHEARRDVQRGADEALERNVLTRRQDQPRPADRVGGQRHLVEVDEVREALARRLREHRERPERARGAAQRRPVVLAERQPPSPDLELQRRRVAQSGRRNVQQRHRTLPREHRSDQKWSPAILRAKTRAPPAEGCYRSMMFRRRR